MNKEQIINEVVRTKKYSDYCKYVCNGREYHQDLYQYVIEYLCSMDEDKIIEIYSGSIEFYIKRIMYLNANHKNTPFWKEYNGGYNINHSEIHHNIVDTTTDDNRQQEWKDSLNNLIEDTLEDEASKVDGHAWEVQLFKIWMQEGCNARKVSQKLGIPYMTVLTQITQLKRIINENIDSY